MPGEPSAGRSRRTLALRIGVPVALIVIGAALEIFVGGTAGIIGAGLIGVAVVLGLANAFYEVGRSEDRDREREAAALAPPPGPRGEQRARAAGSRAGASRRGTGRPAGAAGRTGRRRPHRLERSNPWVCGEALHCGAVLHTPCRPE